MNNAIRGFPFFKEVEAAGESEPFVNHCCSDGTIEFKGTATSFSAEIQGCVDREGEVQWTTLSVVNLSDFSTTSSITGKGIYSVSAMGVSIRIKINSISGGNLTVTGMFLD